MSEEDLALVAIIVLFILSCGYLFLIGFVQQIDNWLTRWKKRRTV
ncbi:MAG: hypothetical protein OXU71_11540 [Gammaproteobacteria bacterium]|nr:hypothetical protein [Gammaproteobacteria bacterium]